MQGRSLAIWTFAVTSVALVMVMLDNLVVSTALNVIRQELGATIEQLEWTVNAYTLTFAVFLLTGAALGDRFGRRRMFIVGVIIFTAASAFAAMSTSVEMLLLGRMAQGIGAAIVTPLTLTLLSAAVSAERRGVALGAWGAVGAMAVAIGPLVGGAIVEGVAWNWIFWVNVPIGIALVPLAWFGLQESYGPDRRLDIPGLVLASVGLFGIVWALVNGNSEGWASPVILGALLAGGLLLVAFVAWERRTSSPMLPPHFFRSRSFDFANLSAMLMSFGMFGAIFLLVQFLQFALGYSPFEAGLSILPWTVAPIIVAPIAGAMSDRISGGLLMGTGLSLQAIGLAWLGLDLEHQRELRRDGRALRHLGCGHGPVLRTHGQRHPLLGEAQRGGQGLRRQQRHPRARRRLRCGRTGDDLRPTRLVRQPAGVHRGHGPGGARGRWDRGARRRSGVPHPTQQRTGSGHRWGRGGPGPTVGNGLPCGTGLRHGRRLTIEPLAAGVDDDARRLHLCRALR